MKWPGQLPDRPFYLQSVVADQVQQSVLDRDNPNTNHSEYKAFDPTQSAYPPGVNNEAPATSYYVNRGRSQSTSRSNSGDAVQQAKTVDFSLGMRDVIASDESGDVYDDNNRERRLPRFKLNRVLEEVERESEEVARSSLARSASRSGSNASASNIFHRRHRANSTSSQGSRIVSHSNRFFGRRSHDEELGMPHSPLTPATPVGASGAHVMHGGRASLEVP